MIDNERTGRRIRKKWLAPLTHMTFADICYLAGAAPLRRLRAIERAMRTVTPTNCSWVEFYAARHLYRIIAREIRAREFRLKKPASRRGAST